MEKNLCPSCGADVDVWREIFNEEHKCPEPRIADTARLADEIDELLSKSPQIMKGKQCPILNNPHMCQESTGCNDCQIWLDWKDAHPQLNV